MATAVRDTVSKEVTSTVQEEVINLALTREEALTLRELVKTVAGSEASTYRRDTLAIARALLGVGVTSYASRFRGTLAAVDLPI